MAKEKSKSDKPTQPEKPAQDEPLHGVISQGNQSGPEPGTPDEAIAAARAAGESLPGVSPLPAAPPPPTPPPAQPSEPPAADETFDPDRVMRQLATDLAEDGRGLYRVVKTKKFSLYGQIVTWHAGDVVEPAQWGPGCIGMLRDAGVELERVS